MSSAHLQNIERVTGSYRARLAGEPITIEAPEWGLTLYFWPATLRDRQKLLAYEGYERAVAEILTRACDAERNLLFGGIPFLGEFMDGADPEAVIRVYNELKKLSIGPKEAQGESKQTPS